MASADLREKIKKVFQDVLQDDRDSLKRGDWEQVLHSIGARPADVGRLLDGLSCSEESREVCVDALVEAVFGSAEKQQESRAAADQGPGTITEGGSSSSSVTLRVVQITDVYMLDNFPHLKTLVSEKAAQLHSSRGGKGKSGSKTISMLTGDFLAPYLLSSIDSGQGMMKMLNLTPIDYLTWGNHEADLPHEEVMLRVQEYEGRWINTNMQDHESFQSCKCQIAYDIVEVKSADGLNTRKVGLIAVLSDEPNLYKPGAFGNAKIKDPWATLTEYKRILEEEEGCDLVLPLCHLYEHQDERTAREFDFPVILSGHDHHVVDRVVNGTRILKPGSDAHCAIVLDLTWDGPGSAPRAPLVEVELVKVQDYKPDLELAKKVRNIYSILDNLRLTQITEVPKEFRPLSSVNSRGTRTSSARFICSSIRDALNLDCMAETPHCDCVLINGGNFRGERDYKDDEHMSLQDLMSEIDEAVEIVVVKLPGMIIRKGLRETWQAVGGGWMQHDDGLEVDDKQLVKTVAGSPIDPEKTYRVGTTKRFGILLVPSMLAYLEEDTTRAANPDAGIPVHSLLMHYFAEKAWAQLYFAMDIDHNGSIEREELRMLDRKGTGSLDRDDILHGLETVNHFKTFKGEYALANLVMKVAGCTGVQEELTLEQINKRRRRRRTELKTAGKRLTLALPSRSTAELLLPEGSNVPTDLQKINSVTEE
eukprot:TRINITY_DN30851_c0_g1_i1.p1 TRINITY_DN30851_c0_g1~~TRINITY_DN30851_c0_g1_i1.p1  ORF type:complete len:705 (+),score=145.59 TRINITY_DN30851_c0_g1_i1:26-2140(+)